MRCISGRNMKSVNSPSINMRKLIFVLYMITSGKSPSLSNSWRRSRRNSFGEGATDLAPGDHVSEKQYV